MVILATRAPALVTDHETRVALPPVTPPDEKPPLRVTIPQHVVFRTFVEETVVLNLESGRYHGLNRTAGRMLELLGEFGEVSLAAERLATETGEPGARVSVDLMNFCDSLVERGLIEVE